MVTFRKLLLNRCQREFEKDKLEEIDLEKIQTLIDAADTVRGSFTKNHLLLKTPPPSLNLLLFSLFSQDCSVTGQNGSGQNGTDKMVRTKWYTDKMVLDKMVRTKWYGQNG